MVTAAKKTAKRTPRKTAPKSRAKKVAKAAAPVASNVVDGGQKIADIPWQDPTEKTTSAFGKSAGKDGITAAPEVYVNDKVIQNFKGAGVISTNDGRVVNITSRHNYIGARLGSSDSTLADSTLYNNRDAGTWRARDAGNCQTLQVHNYGAQIADRNEGADANRATGDTFADAYIGVFSDGWRSSYVHCLFQHNKTRDAVLRGHNHFLLGCQIHVQAEVNERNFSVPGLPTYDRKAGIELDGYANKVIECLVDQTNWKHPAETYTGQPTQGGVLVNCDKSKVTGVFMDSDGLVGTRGIVFLPGAHRGSQIDCEFQGFSDPADRPVAWEPGASIDGLDATVRVDGFSKALGVYLSYLFAQKWTGKFRLVDAASGDDLAWAR